MFMDKTVVICSGCGAMAPTLDITVPNAPDIVKHKPPRSWETKLGTNNTVHLCPSCARSRRRREARRRRWEAVKRLFRLNRRASR